MPCLLCGSLDVPTFFNPYHLCKSSDTACIPCVEMELLEERISETKTALKKMLKRHAELRARMNRAHNPIIHRLPPELPSYIFELCVPLNNTSTSPMTDIERCAPLIIGAVCRGWRQIAWSTPRIWTFISIFLESQKFPVRYELAREWLNRSGQLPLTIHITAPATISPSLDSRLGPMIEFINQHSSRWKELHLTVPPRFVSRFCGDSGGAPVLHTLKLQYMLPNLFCDIPDKNPFSLKHGKPMPSNVSISYFCSRGVDIEWGYITHLFLGSISLTECISVLKSAPRLIHYALSDVSIPSSPPHRPHKPIVHQVLRELDVSTNFRCWVGLFFEAVTLPGLESISMCLQKNDVRLSTDAFISLVKRSCADLKSLSISYKASGQPQELHRLLRSTPSLLHFNLQGTSGDLFDHFCHLLADSPLDKNDPDIADPFLPTLESICFTPTGVNPFNSWDLLPDILDIHYLHRRPIRKVQIATKRSRYEPFGPPELITRDSVIRFLELIHAGVTLDFRVRDYFEEYFCDMLTLSMDFHDITGEDFIPGL
ncbi:hypothetical protein GALMADRAFT_244302 [Galerina marginata CBS 339.88]|uniref:Uncharacterized protein n=1 Tax=Galerina marginata (strain CBS 339.88) TaxID=685588 RepID=A0A067T8Q7_GALM3|nr:hypothetical protein GALMADRAFT_244302 [Galerina marginata CBS 339.88]